MFALDSVVTSSLNSDPHQSSEVSVSGESSSTPSSESRNDCDHGVTVKDVWSKAGQVKGTLTKGKQPTLTCKSLESVVLSLHSTAKGTKEMSLPNADECDSYSHDAVRIHLSPECSAINCIHPTILQNGDQSPTDRDEGIVLPVLSSEGPYPVFLPNIQMSGSETNGTISLLQGDIKQEVDLNLSSSDIPSSSPNNVEVEVHGSASPSTLDSLTQRHEIHETTVTAAASNGLSYAGCTTKSATENECGTSHSNNQEKAEGGIIKASSTGDSAFFDFLLTQESEFNPAMKFQIVELIKSEYGKKMAVFDSELSKTEIEKRRLEAEIHSSHMKLQQKEEEKLRLFTEIDNLQKSIAIAVERQKLLAEQAKKLTEESKAVKRKISSCEEVERGLCCSPAVKMNKLAER